MKKKELNSLREKGYEELRKLAQERRTELLRLRAKIKSQRESNQKSAKNLRRTLAQILTIMRERQILEEESKKVEKEGK